MKKLLTAFAMALLLVGCAKEYNDKELRDRVTTLETKVGNLEAQMLVAQKVALGEFVQKVEEVEDGLTITYGDGTVLTVHVSTGSGAGTLSVLKNAAGDLCWAIDGTILQYEGKDLVVGAVSNIYVQDGKLFAVINGEAKELGGFSGGSELKDGIFTGVELTGEAVVLTLSDGSKINIPLAKAFKLVIAKTQYAVTTTDAFDVEYTVQAKTANTVVDIFTDANYEAEVQADKFVITPKAVVKGSALAYADSQVGLTSIVKLNFGAEGEADKVEITDDPYSTDIDYLAEATDGLVEAHIVANVSLNAESFRPTVSWIKVKDVKATNYTLTLEIEDNPTEEIRTGAVEIYPAGADKPIQTITIAQKAGEPAPVEQTYRNWQKVLNLAGGAVNTTFKWDNSLQLNPSAVTLQWKFYANKWNNHKFQDRDENNNQLYSNRLAEFNGSGQVLLRFSNDGDADGQLCLNAAALGLDQVQVTKDNAAYVWPTGKWVVLTLVCDGSKLSVYSDNTLVNAYNVTPGSSWTVNRYDISMTADGWTAAQAFNGDLAFTRIWSRALSASDVASTLCDVPANQKENLEIYWAFDGKENTYVVNEAKSDQSFSLDFEKGYLNEGARSADNSAAATAAWKTPTDLGIDAVCEKGADEPEQPEQPTGTIKALYWGNKDNAVWYKNFPAAISLPNGYSMTIHFYYDTAKKQRLCNFGDASEAPCNMLRFGEQTDRNNELEWMVDTGSGRIKIYADGAEEGKWNAITVTAGANGYVTYMNGTKKNSNTEASYRQNTSFQAFEFADSWGDRGAFDGAIAYVSLWDKQLSDEEVAANVFKKPSGDGLKLFWAMTEGQGYFLEETAGKVSGDYAIDFTECKRKNGNDVEGSADVSNTIEWKEYPAFATDSPATEPEPEEPSDDPVKALYWGNKDNAVWYKNFPAAISLPNGYSMTIHFYYDTAKKQRLCNFGDASEAPCNMLRFGEQTDRNNELEWMVDTGSGRVKIYADGAVAGQWNAITVTAGANGYVTYMNGTKKNSNTQASYRQNTSFQAFEFADSWGDRGAFDGAIAYVSLWDKQLSDEEVAANVFKKPSGDGLKLFWAMTEGQGYFLEETAGKVSGDYAIDFTECKRKNGNDVEGSADVSNTIEWKEYPAIKAPVAAE